MGHSECFNACTFSNLLLMTNTYCYQHSHLSNRPITSRQTLAGVAGGEGTSGLANRVISPTSIRLHFLFVSTVKNAKSLTSLFSCTNKDVNATFLLVSLHRSNQLNMKTYLHMHHTLVGWGLVFCCKIKLLWLLWLQFLCIALNIYIYILLCFSIFLLRCSLEIKLYVYVYIYIS